MSVKLYIEGGGEGQLLDSLFRLQSCCTDLFHFDLSWNPGRIEQRKGRIDRNCSRTRRR